MSSTERHRQVNKGARSPLVLVISVARMENETANAETLLGFTIR